MKTKDCRKANAFIGEEQANKFKAGLRLSGLKALALGGLITRHTAINCHRLNTGGAANTN